MAGEADPRSRSRSSTTWAVAGQGSAGRPTRPQGRRRPRRRRTRPGPRRSPTAWVAPATRSPSRWPARFPRPTDQPMDVRDANCSYQDPPDANNRANGVTFVRPHLDQPGGVAQPVRAGAVDTGCGRRRRLLLRRGRRCLRVRPAASLDRLGTGRVRPGGELRQADRGRPHPECATVGRPYAPGGAAGPPWSCVATVRHRRAVPIGMAAEVLPTAVGQWFERLLVRSGASRDGRGEPQLVPEDRAPTMAPPRAEQPSRLVVR